jgi:hypothetical protein
MLQRFFRVGRKPPAGVWRNRPPDVKQAMDPPRSASGMIDRAVLTGSPDDVGAGNLRRLTQ